VPCPDGPAVGEAPCFSAIRCRRRTGRGRAPGSRPGDLPPAAPGPRAPRAQDPPHADRPAHGQDRRRDRRDDDGRPRPARRADVRLDPFDNATAFARHALLRSMLRATTWFRDACASRHKGGVETAIGRLRRRLPRRADPDTMSDDDIQEIAMTLNRATQMPPLPVPRRGLPRRSWQGSRYPLPWPRCTSRLNPPSAFSDL
jgi:hypothetical protein